MVEIERLAAVVISENSLGQICWKNKLNIGKLLLSFVFADDCITIRRTDQNAISKGLIRI